MITVAFEHSDPDMPRTVFYERLSDAIRALPCFVEEGALAELIFPREDTALETNWPRYGRPESAFSRGQFDPVHHCEYLNRLIASGRTTCVINMYPYMRMPVELSAFSNIIVADNNLLTWERSINPRTIAMLAFPITTGRFRPEAKLILASFRGVMSHPCRQMLRQLHNGSSVIIDIVERGNHFGRIDAEVQEIDAVYAELLEQSIFALVPRGDLEFSYRLAEVMSFGCIPVVVSDGLILPFDRLIDWDNCAIRVPESRIPGIAEFLGRVSPSRIAEMQSAVVHNYSTWLGGFAEVAGAIVAEAAIIMRHRMNGDGRMS